MQIQLDEKYLQEILLQIRKAALLCLITHSCYVIDGRILSKVIDRVIDYLSYRLICFLSII